MEYWSLYTLMEYWSLYTFKLVQRANVMTFLGFFKYLKKWLLGNLVKTIQGTIECLPYVKRSNLLTLFICTSNFDEPPHR